MPAVQVEFAVLGTKRVLEAFKTISKASQDAERSQVRGAQNYQRTAEKSAEAARKAKEREYGELFKQIDRGEKAQAKAAAAATKAEEREGAKRIAAFESLERRKIQIQKNSAEMANRYNEKLAREAEQKQAARKRLTGGIAGTITSSIGSTVRGIAGVAGTLTALGGGFSIADSVHQRMTNEGKAADLENQSEGAVKKGQILDKAGSIATQYGTSTEKVIDALDQFVAKSGDAKAGMAQLGNLTALATATGGDLTELARTAGIATLSTGNSEDAMKVMRMFAGQGRAGSVDMRDLAQYGGRITGGAASFADKDKAFNELGAFAQVASASGHATDAAEATNSVARFSSDLFKHEASIQALTGKSIRDKANPMQLKSVREIVKDLLVSSGGDRAKFEGRNKLGEQSVKGMLGFSDVYNNTKGTQKEKLAAVDAAFDKFTNHVLTDTQVQTESSRRLQEADKQFESALNQLRDAVGKELLPEFTKLVPKIRELIPEFVRLIQSATSFAEWFAANPLTGLGALVLANVTKDLAAAGIGAGVKAALIAMIGNVSGAGTAAGGGALGQGVAAGGAVAGGLAVAGGAVLGGGLGVLGVSISSRSQLGAQRDSVNGSLASGNAISDLMSGPMTPEKMDKLRGMRSGIEDKIAEAKSKRENAGPGAIVAAYAGLTGSDDAIEAQRAEQAAYTTTIKGLTVDLDRLQKAVKKAEEALADKPSAASPAQNVGMANPLRSGTN